MPITPPTPVLKTDAWLGVIKVNHNQNGYSYHYYMNTNDDVTAVTRLAQVCNRLKFILPVGSFIFDAVIYQPDSDKYGRPAISDIIPSRAVDIITPDGGDPDLGYVPNDPKTCLHIGLETVNWAGREFLRTPPDAYITDGRWTGLPFAEINQTSAAVAFTANTSVSPTKVAGTWEERLQDYYYFIMNTLQYEWRQKAGDDLNIEISRLRYIYQRGVTSHRMGRAFLRGVQK